jgi:hypothetical protein
VCGGVPILSAPASTAAVWAYGQSREAKLGKFRDGLGPSLKAKKETNPAVLFLGGGHSTGQSPHPSQNPGCHMYLSGAYFAVKSRERPVRCGEEKTALGEGGVNPGVSRVSSLLVHNPPHLMDLDPQPHPPSLIQQTIIASIYWAFAPCQHFMWIIPLDPHCQYLLCALMCQALCSGAGVQHMHLPWWSLGSSGGG